MGLKKPQKKDVALLVSSTDCTAAGVFTQNRVQAAPVHICREVLATGSDQVRAVVANSGNANACTGRQGLADGHEMQRTVATHLKCRSDQVLVLSTGVIGELLDMEKINRGIATAAAALRPDGGRDAAQAIMTTDTRPKHVNARWTSHGQTVTIGGMAKGSGMIHPNMATMLAVLTTDVDLSSTTLQTCLRRAVDASFNRISVDGDTSTNDTVLLLANGAAAVCPQADEQLADFQDALNAVCRDLAQKIVRDGEGATKFVEIRVSGALSEQAAHRIAETMATSPLVKTAFTGSDPNWGRLLAAAGRAGVSFDPDTVDLSIGTHSGDELTLLQNGMPTGYAEEQAAAIFAGESFEIHFKLRQGTGETVYWTTDLSHQYVSINADYRT